MKREAIKMGARVLAPVPMTDGTTQEHEGEVVKITSSGREAHVAFVRPNKTVLTLSIPVGELRLCDEVR